MTDKGACKQLSLLHSLSGQNIKSLCCSLANVMVCFFSYSGNLCFPNMHILNI